MFSKLLTPPATMPLTNDEVSDFCRVERGTDDLQLAMLQAAAVASIEGSSGMLGRCLITQTWVAKLECFGPVMVLPFPDVSGVVVKYLDVDGVEQTIPEASYEILAGSFADTLAFMTDYVVPDTSGDVAQPITLEITAGFGDADSVPDQIKGAILQMVAHWYDFRPGDGVQAQAVELSPAVKSGLRRYRPAGLV